MYAADFVVVRHKKSEFRNPMNNGTLSGNFV